jgi:hypothetical protein
MTERMGNRFLVGGALGVFLVGMLLAVAFGVGDGDEGRTAAPTTRAAPTTTATTRRPAPRPKPGPRPARFVRLAPAGAFDPEGDGRERDEEAGLAVDGRADTAWRTERYSSFFKHGVGLVLDAGRTVRVEQVVVDTPSPGYRAEIRLGASRRGPFVVASPARTVTARTRFPVARRAGRYVVVWVVELPPHSAGEVAEVRVRAR